METVNGSGKASTALTVVSASTALEPSSFNEALAMAGHLAKSGVLGKAVTRPEAALAVILAGRELGLTAMQSLRSIHIIEGKTTLSADLMLALVKKSPTCKFFKLVESTAKVATYETERLGEGVTRLSFTIEEAGSAKLTGKDNWKNYPAAMLRARCIAALARAVYPDLLMGVYETDEIQARSTDGIAFAQPTNEGVIDAEFTTDPAEQTIADYKKAIEAAPTAADLKRIGESISKEPARVKAALGEVYAARKTALAKPADRQPGEEG